MAKKKQAEQVILDEAVAAKGGKPGSDFVEELKKATGAAAAEERAAEAAEHFDRRAMVPTREVLRLSQLQPMKANPRGELGDVSALVKSIEANGFIGALSVRETVAGSFEVWAGNRRLKAAKEAGLEEVPCDVYDLTDAGEEFGTYQGFDEDFLELAKKHGFDPQRMVATRLAAEGKAA